MAVRANGHGLIPPALLSVAVLAAYANSFSGAFQFDDYRVIVDYAPVHSWQGWAGDLGGLRPLLKASYAFSWTTGEDTFSFHLFNLLVHLANTSLVYALALAFGKCSGTGLDWRWPAFAAALLFALHPAHSEAVTYVSGRSSSLMTLFYLAALWSYARWVQGGKGMRWLALCLFALAALVKESAMLFPFALLLWEWACRTPWRTVAARQWPFWLLSGLGALALLSHPGYLALMAGSLHRLGLHDAFLTQLHGAGKLLGQLIWPTALNIDPDLPRVHEVIAVWQQLAALALLLAAAWHFRDTRPWISFGLGWLLLHLLALNTVFPRADIANERQLYWADWGLFLMLAVEIDLALARRHATAALALVAAALFAVTVARNEVYRSEVALWEDTVRKSPDKARAHNNLGYAYQQAGRHAEAEQAYARAIALQPGYVKAVNNLAAVRGKR